MWPIFSVCIVLAAQSGPQTVRTDSRGLHYYGKNEVVMTPGMRITAKTPVGTIRITATSALTRSYTWEGATRSLEMDPRPARWYGSLGLDYPGPGDHWAEHNGITRAVVAEGQQPIHSLAEFKKFVKDNSYHPVVYRNDGIVVTWGKVLERRQLDVEVWQIVLNGRKPVKLPGANDKAIQVDFVSLNTSPVIAALEAHDLARLKRELQKGSSPNTPDASGRAPLVIAIEARDVAAAKALLEAGANPNAQMLDSSSLLDDAIDNEQLGIAKLLLDHGANPNQRMSRGMTQGQSPLFTAVMMGNLSYVQLLLNHGADVNLEDAGGDTPLSTAAGWRKSPASTGIVQVLIDHGANVNHRSKLAQTPLMTAALSGNLEAVKLLVEHGADLNARNDVAVKLCWTLEFSGYPQDLKAVKRLQQAGLLDKFHEDGGSALDFAEDKEMRSYLISKGAKSFAVEAQRRTEDLWKLADGK